MQISVIDKLVQLNNTFYQTFGKPFAITRKRIQPGILRCLTETNKTGNWLDLGCGGGTVAEAWANTSGRKGSYLGVDFSTVLLSEANNLAEKINKEHISIDFLQGDLASKDFWHNLDERNNQPSSLSDHKFDVISAFAVFHHIPDAGTRQKIITEINKRLKQEGLFILSVWQLQNSPRLLARQQPWETVGLSVDDLEDGDVLMDWRFSLPGQKEQVGLRYVHLFNRDELEALAQSTGFNILQSFESDGEGNRLGLYQVWQKRV